MQMSSFANYEQKNLEHSNGYIVVQAHHLGKNNKNRVLGRIILSLYEA